jgi:hypothetical protein
MASAPVGMTRGSGRARSSVGSGQLRLFTHSEPTRSNPSRVHMGRPAYPDVLRTGSDYVGGWPVLHGLPALELMVGPAVYGRA